MRIGVRNKCIVYVFHQWGDRSSSLWHKFFPFLYPNCGLTLTFSQCLVLWYFITSLVCFGRVLFGLLESCWRSLFLSWCKDALPSLPHILLKKSIGIALALIPSWWCFVFLIWWFQLSLFGVFLRNPNIRIRKQRKKHVY